MGAGLDFNNGHASATVQGPLPILTYFLSEISLGGSSFYNFHFTDKETGEAAAFPRTLS